MTALNDSMSETRYATYETRSSATATRNVAQVRRFSLSPRRTSSAVPSSRFAVCLRRLSSVGLRLIVTAPGDNVMFARGIRLFPGRRIDVSAHVQWETAYRVFCGRGRQPHDRGSWRILAVDRDDRVVGAITARFFCGNVDQQYLHVLSLLDMTGPVFREHCELAISELIAASTKAARTPAEISNWAVSPVWHAGLIAVSLVRAMGALVAAFDAPLVIMAADNRRGEVNRLMRLGCTPLSVGGHSCLPPFVHHESGAWLRLLALDTAGVQARAGDTSTADLALLRERVAIISTS
jgi:hypothetical protein